MTETDMGLKWKPFDMNPFNVNLPGGFVFDFNDNENDEDSEEEQDGKKKKKERTDDFIDLSPF